MLALSAEKLISDRMKMIDLKASALAAVTRALNHYVPETTISRALNGQKSFDREVSLYLMDLVSKIETIAKAAYPLRLDMRDAQTLAQLVREADEIPNDLPTLPDLLLVSQILAGHDSKELAENRNISLPELAEKTSEIGIKLGRAASRISEIIEGENVNA